MSKWSMAMVGTGEVLSVGDINERMQVFCPFCKTPMILRRPTNRRVHVATYPRGIHTHPVCKRIAEKNIEYTFDESADNFHIKMLAEQEEKHKNKSGTGKDRDSTPYDDERVVKIRSLNDLLESGMIKCTSNVRITSNAYAADYFINSEIAQEYFAGGLDRDLGGRAIMAQVECWDLNSKWMSYILWVNDGKEKKIIRFFHLFHENPELQIKICDKISIESARLGGAKVNVLIYGDWTINGCARCKVTMGRGITAECSDQRCKEVSFFSKCKRNYILISQYLQEELG